MTNKYIVWFDEVGLDDVALVGGKNASLGEMICNLKQLGIEVPFGFAITTHAYQYFLEHNNLVDTIKNYLKVFFVSVLDNCNKVFWWDVLYRNNIFIRILYGI